MLGRIAHVAHRDQHVRQRAVVVTVAVAHVTAKENRGVIEHGTVRLLRGLQLLNESCEHFRVVLLNLDQLVHFLSIVTVM